MAEIIEKEGIITEIIFYNEENGYLVGVFETGEEEFTIVGFLPSCDVGRSYMLSGEFKVHPKFGDQFAFATYREIMPTTILGIEGFLSSKIIKGVGPKKAREIVKAFGTETFEIIEKEPERLIKIPGIGKKRGKEICAALKEHRAFADTTLFLQQYGVSADFALKLYKVYGAGTIEAVKGNPYQLVEDVFGIGFKKADLIAEKMGIASNDEARIQGGIKYVLSRFAADGHGFLPMEELKEKVGALLEVSTEEVGDSIINLSFEGGVDVDIIEGQEVVFLPVYYEAEKSVCKRLVALAQSSIKPITLDVEDLIKATEKELNIEFSDEQTRAIGTVINNGVSVITGGPGTGKTTIINGLLNILEHGNIKTAIAAPTGRAAKRITETTGREASTIHRLLEYFFSEAEGFMRFGKTSEEPLEYDAIIVDEASMIDILLMDGLLKAIKDGTRLIIVGDADQLPSVGVGNVLRDIIDSEYIYSIQLKEIFRQAKESMIVVNAHRINQGELPSCNEKDKDFFFMNKNGETEILKLILDLCQKRLPSYYESLDKVRDMQVLTPRRKGLLGSENLNKELQKVLNPPNFDLQEKTYGDRIFRENDKVMQIRNNYEMTWQRNTDFTKGQGIFNGDVGYIYKIDKEFNKVIVVFDGDKFVDYEFTDLEELELAYAITVHKSQGSEFQVVIMPMAWAPEVLATRNLLYTGVTRGKTAVVLVGSEQRMEDMIKNNRIKWRNSGLSARIKAMM